MQQSMRMIIDHIQCGKRSPVKSNRKAIFCCFGLIFSIRKRYRHLWSTNLFALKKSWIQKNSFEQIKWLNSLQNRNFLVFDWSNLFQTCKTLQKIGQFLSCFFAQQCVDSNGPCTFTQKKLIGTVHQVSLNISKENIVNGKVLP